ncbi:MAG: hypothetical protein IPL79_00725 [Myxococcales bacterium]|nr:hypothetical protein [Myxococcales bacterium]
MLDVHEGLSVHIAVIRRDLLRREKRRALWATIGLSIALGMLMPWAVGELGLSVRAAQKAVALFLLGYLAALGFAIYWYVWRPHRAYVSDRAVAWWLYGRDPALGSHVLAGVDLSAERIAGVACAARKRAWDRDGFAARRNPAREHPVG